MFSSATDAGFCSPSMLHLLPVLLHLKVFPPIKMYSLLPSHERDAFDSACDIDVGVGAGSFVGAAVEIKSALYSSLLLTENDEVDAYPAVEPTSTAKTKRSVDRSLVLKKEAIKSVAISNRPTCCRDEKTNTILMLSKNAVSILAFDPIKKKIYVSKKTHIVQNSFADSRYPTTLHKNRLGKKAKTKTNPKISL